MARNPTPQTLDKGYLFKEFQKACAHLDDILSGKKAPGEVIENPPGKEEQELFYQRAANALRVEDYENAEKMFSTLLMLNNRDIRAAMGLAAAAEGQGRYEFAMPIYYMVLATTPYDPVAPFRAGICLMNLGKPGDAKKAFGLAADCRDKIKDPAKKIYVDRAQGMLKALSAKGKKNDRG